ARVERITFADSVPRVLRQLLHTERYALVFDIDSEDHRFDLVAFLHEFRRMANFLGPRKIGDMDQPVDSWLDLHEHSEVGKRFYLPFHAAAGGMLVRERLP